MKKELDFYSKTSLKSYNLDNAMRYQLNMLDKLDVFTRKHSENVANITCRLCEYMHLSKDFTVYCTICAYLHDIGKMFIPSKILQKNGPLTDEEYEVMKTHTTIGYNMCFNDLKLRPYLAGPLYHHEALNGSGYPKGLTSSQIPLEGQIIRVADEFDAITSKRQYKSHIGITDALKILIQNSKPFTDISKGETTEKVSKSNKLGKINPYILKRLFKVVIDDTEYEISQCYNYLDYLQGEIKRLNKIHKYYEKMSVQKKESKQKYYEYNLKLLFSPGETMTNYQNILNEYKIAYQNKKQNIDALFTEVKNIKKLKV